MELEDKKESNPESKLRVSKQEVVRDVLHTDGGNGRVEGQWIPMDGGGVTFEPDMPRDGG